MTDTYAMACPSEVDVPRPSSSSATSELRVAEDCINHKKNYINGMKTFHSNSSAFIMKIYFSKQVFKSLKK
jgi:hypothetical protein